MGSSLARQAMEWNLGRRTLLLGERTLVMGILNLTPDSFSGDGLGAADGADGGVAWAKDDAARVTARAVAQGLRMLDEGAAMLDLGAESTRPGSGAASERAISSMQEQDRLLPVLEALRRTRPEAVLSVDTYRASTAAAALAAGADIVNDVSGLLWDPKMASVCAQASCGVALMHTRGRPDEWRSLPAVEPEAVLALVRDGLQERLAAAETAGIAMDRTVLDPGYGFGKAFGVNYALLHQQAALLALGRPLLVGVSRKSFLGRALAERLGLELPAAARDTASVAAAVAAVLRGASVVRVHAVAPTVEAVAIADAILEAGLEADDEAGLGVG